MFMRHLRKDKWRNDRETTGGMIGTVAGGEKQKQCVTFSFFKESRESTNQITKLQYLSKVASSVMRFCSLTWQFLQRFIVTFKNYVTAERQRFSIYLGIF